MEVTLRLLRQARRLTLRDAGKAVGVSSQTISRWESGQTEPGAREAARYAEVLGVSHAEFVRMLEAAQKEGASA